ncbi:MAG TPA: hypothetical protein PKG52_09080 [bacterium]|nr:hypothetical protein [bacterium]
MNFDIRTSLIKIDSATSGNGIFSPNSNENYFIENDYSSSNFYLKKLFFRKNIPFHSFGFLDDSDNIVYSEGSLDIGSDLDKLNRHHTGMITEKSTAKNFNGLLAIDPPPETIPTKYLFHFRYPLNIVKAYVSIMDKTDRINRHMQVKILSGPGTVDVSEFFKKRAVKCSDLKELEPGTTVITWSTARFFTLLNLGFRPVAGTRCLALWAYRNKERRISDMILEDPHNDRIETIRNYICSQSIEKVF